FNQNRFHKDHRTFFLSSIGIFRDHRGSAAVSSAVIAPKRQCCFKTAYLFIYSMTFMDYCQEHVNDGESSFVGLQYILDSEEKKKVQEDAKSVIVELHKQQ
ncbi:MAG: hypothetical protein IKP72_18145, partial [Clostridia bacterium]|nr:hypothetical protein [Clostridia bacterium]